MSTSCCCARPEKLGYWHLVAGGVEWGEEPDAAAVRELAEETALEASVTPLEGPLGYDLAGDPESVRARFAPGTERVTVWAYLVEAPPAGSRRSTPSTSTTGGSRQRTPSALLEYPEPRQAVLAGGGGRMIVGIDTTPLVQTRAGTARHVSGLARSVGGKARPRARRAVRSRARVGSRPSGAMRCGTRSGSAAAPRLDVLHCTTFRGPLRPRTPLVVTVHDLALLRLPEVFPRWHRDTGRRALRSGVRAADAVVAVSEFTRDELVELLDVPRERIRVIPNGVDPVFRPDGAASRRRLRARGRNARATQEPRRCGRGGAAGRASSCASRARRDGVASRSPGWVGEPTDEELAALYRGARCLVFPSLYEGFGLPVLEAMACGTPVVTSDSRGDGRARRRSRGARGRRARRRRSRPASRPPSPRRDGADSSRARARRGLHLVSRLPTVSKSSGGSWREPRRDRRRRPRPRANRRRDLHAQPPARARRSRVRGGAPARRGDAPPRARPRGDRGRRASERRRRRCAWRGRSRVFCARLGADLVHTQYALPLRCPCPAVVTIHDLSFEKRPVGDEAARAPRVPLGGAARGRRRAAGAHRVRAIEARSCRASTASRPSKVVGHAERGRSDLPAVRARRPKDATRSRSARSRPARTSGRRSPRRRRRGSSSSWSARRRTRRWPPSCEQGGARLEGYVTHRATRRALPRRRVPRAAVSLRGLRSPGRRGDGVRHPRRHRGRAGARRGRRRRGGRRRGERPRRRDRARRRRPRAAQCRRDRAGQGVQLARVRGGNRARLRRGAGSMRVSAIVVSHGHARRPRDAAAGARGAGRRARGGRERPRLRPGGDAGRRARDRERTAAVSRGEREPRNGCDDRRATSST